MEVKHSAHLGVHGPGPRLGQALEERPQPGEVAHHVQRRGQLLGRVGEGRLELWELQVVKRAGEGIVGDDVERQGRDAAVEHDRDASAPVLLLQNVA